MVTMTKGESLTELRSPFVGSQSPKHQHIQTIDWHMLDKERFYPLSMLSSFSIRCVLYPFTVVKTQLQIQSGKSKYSGTFDCFCKTFKKDGMPGLYKGFWINTFQLASGIMYVTSYEGLRHVLRNFVEDNRLRAFLAGGAASAAAQTCIVPFDVISQHMMVLGKKTNPLELQLDSRRKGITLAIIKEVYRRDGIKGFYRGYIASLATFVPNSGLWWGFYHFYSEKIVRLVPDSTPQLLVQVMSAPMAGWSAATLTNPLDCMRTRIQVQRLTIPKTFTNLWQEEGLRIFTKGLSARLVQTTVYSMLIITGYESIKRLSVKNEYKDSVKW